MAAELLGDNPLSAVQIIRCRASRRLGSAHRPSAIARALPTRARLRIRWPSGLAWVIHLSPPSHSGYCPAHYQSLRLRPERIRPFVSPQRKRTSCDRSTPLFVASKPRRAVHGAAEWPTARLRGLRARPQVESRTVGVSRAAPPDARSVGVLVHPHRDR